MSETRQKLTHYKAAIERENLGQADLADGFGGWREATVEIAEVPVLYRPRKPKKGEKKNKYLFKFVGKRKAWISGPVTQATIASLYGPFLERWQGKKITLYVDPAIMMGGVRTGGIRVRPTIPSGSLSTEPLDEPIDEEGAAAREAAADAMNESETRE